MDYYVFMTALVEVGWIAKNSAVSATFGIFDLISNAHAFGREPNALPELCNCLMPNERPDQPLPY